MLSIVMAGLLGLGLPGMEAAEAPPVLAPSGKWDVVYGKDDCVLQRSYGAGADQVMFGWRARPFAQRITMLFVRRSAVKGFRQGVLDVTVTPGAHDDGFMESAPLPDGQRVMQGLFETRFFAGIADDAVLTVRPSHDRPFAIALGEARSAFDALTACTDELARTWGVDPAERTRVAIPAVGIDMAEWVQHEDYPPEVIRRGEEGDSTLLWTIDAAGKVQECRAVVSSGSADIDRAGCAAILKRAHFRPAIGRDGQPMVSHGADTMRWRLPTFEWKVDDAYYAKQKRDRRKARDDASAHGTS